MTTTAEKIKALLGDGLSNEVVATAVGVSPSYISQLMADRLFADEVIALRTQALTAASGRDRSWDGLEDKLLDRLHQIVDQHMIYKPQDLIRTLHVVNGAKRRGNPVHEQLTVNKTVVSIRLPTVVVNQYRKNDASEVIEVTTPEGITQTLATMPAIALMRKLSESHPGTSYEQIRKYLPNSDKEENIAG